MALMQPGETPGDQTPAPLVKPIRDGEVRFDWVENSLSCYLAGLWRLAPVVAAQGDVPGHEVARRSRFSEHFVSFPPAYRGYSGVAGRALYYAAAAHLGAHLRHGGARFALGELKPIQITLVSLLEDARVEALAVRQYPGLLHLWLPFHVAEPGAAATSTGLMARLSRALVDPAYDDPHEWVRKGRRLFADAEHRRHEPGVSRTIGSLLGNDLGQMRVQFNFRTYAVEPVYRDDNTGLWEFPPSDAEPTPMQISVPRSARRGDTASDLPQPVPPDSPPSDRPLEAKLASGDRALGNPVATYAEWDYAIRRERTDWVSLLEGVPPFGNMSAIDRLAEQDRLLGRRLTAVVRTARIDRPSWLRRQVEGEALDLEAAVRSAVDARVGLAPDLRVYARRVRRERSLSSLLLLDVSESTNERMKASPYSVFEFQRRAVSLFADSLSKAGDAYAIMAFCSNGRHEVRYLRVKNFEEAYDRAAQARLAGLYPGLSTRMGAAIRHAGQELIGRPSHRRLLIVVSDGEPSDVDVGDRRYLIEDARHAVMTLAKHGVHVVCLSVNSENSSGLAAIFGRRNIVLTRDLWNLPQELSLMYVRLAG